MSSLYSRVKIAKSKSTFLIRVAPVACPNKRKLATEATKATHIAANCGRRIEVFLVDVKKKKKKKD